MNLLNKEELKVLKVHYSFAKRALFTSYKDPNLISPSSLVKHITLPIVLPSNFT